MARKTEFSRLREGSSLEKALLTTGNGGIVLLWALGKRISVEKEVMQKEKRMDPSPVLELNAFVPARDFDVSKQFYSDIGFDLAWSNDDIASFKIASFSFLLQRFHVQQHSENFVMSLMVEDADRWWEHFERIGLQGKYPHIMLKRPAMQPWGIRVLYVSDPTGVLWHIADRKNA